MPRGRPKAENSRELLLRVRLTEAEYRYLQSLAMKQGKSMSDVVRSLVLADMPKERTEQLR